MAHFDVVVCGLGAMGSAALHRLAGRRLRVLGLERFEPGHDRGSSHGATRVIRLSYFEHPSYVPLVRRAYELWRGLEQDAGSRLLHVTGIAEIGPPDGALVKGTLASARQHDIRHEVVTAPQLMQRLPIFRVPADFVGVLQPDGGFLATEPAVRAQLTLARAAGATIRSGETVNAIEPRHDRVEVVTARERIEAGSVIVSAGAWVKTLVPALAVPMRVTRQVMAWFQPVIHVGAGDLPVFLLESHHGIHYGFPADGNGLVKAAKHPHGDELVDPDAGARPVDGTDEALIRAMLADHLPGINGRVAAAATCLYTMTPDGDFVIDRMPGAPNVIVASPCSGHGFKFAPVVGEILADLVTEGKSRRDISRFAIGRFG
jgi:sarcosine oxidase